VASRASVCIHFDLLPAKPFGLNLRLKLKFQSQLLVGHSGRRGNERAADGPRPPDEMRNFPQTGRAAGACRLCENLLSAGQRLRPYRLDEPRDSRPTDVLQCVDLADCTLASHIRLLRLFLYSAISP